MFMVVQAPLPGQPMSFRFAQAALCLLPLAQVVLTCSQEWEPPNQCPLYLQHASFPDSLPRDYKYSHICHIKKKIFS